MRVTRDLAAIEVPVEHAKVRARGERARTNERGVGRLAVRPRDSGRIVVKAEKPGFAAAKATAHHRPK